MITQSLNMTKQRGDSFSERSVEMIAFVCKEAVISFSCLAYSRRTLLSANQISGFLINQSFHGYLANWPNLFEISRVAWY